MSPSEDSGRNEFATLTARSLLLPAGDIVALDLSYELFDFQIYIAGIFALSTLLQPWAEERSTVTALQSVMSHPSSSFLRSAGLDATSERTKNTHCPPAPALLFSFGYWWNRSENKLA